MDVMRWDAQRLDIEDPTTLPGMPSVRGLLRSVQVPEFPGLTFHEVRLMPGVIRALAESGTPFSILTKGTLLRRDIPLLAEAAETVPLGLGVSMAIWDGELHTALEPGVPTPRARLDLIRALADAGLPCGVFLAPVLPGLTDGTAELDAALGAVAAAGATGVTVIPLHLRPGAREWFMAWL